MNTGIIKLTPELLALLGTGTSTNLQPFSREIFLLDIVVAGTTHCPEIHDIEPKLLPETILRMVRDPKNKYDTKAIGIYYDKTRIGWVPRELNLVISRLMDAGKAFFCRVVSVNDVNTWVKINAKVYMVE
jgi:hypothetical protein